LAELHFYIKGRLCLMGRFVVDENLPEELRGFLAEVCQLMLKEAEP